MSVIEFDVDVDVRAVIEVLLNKDELAAGTAVGCRRQIEAIGSAKMNFPDDDNVRWQQHIEAACAEIAVSKHRGTYWVGCGPQARYDVMGGQVRAILQPHHSLILRPYDELAQRGDKPEDAFILVYAKAPRYMLIGWAWGHEVMRDEFVVTNERDPKPYWQVPQSGLRLMP